MDNINISNEDEEMKEIQAFQNAKKIGNSDEKANKKKSTSSYSNAN